MSEGWRYLAFGIELGPMSWEDLCERARRGDLAVENQVRQGEQGPWLSAGNVPGLFAPAAGELARDEAWHCEVLGAELGPMSWEDLCLLARRGNLKADNRVRRGAEGDWIRADSVAGLFPSVDAISADADFELVDGQSLAQPTSNDVEFEISSPQAQAECASEVTRADSRIDSPADGEPAPTLASSSDPSRSLLQEAAATSAPSSAVGASPTRRASAPDRLQRKAERSKSPRATISLQIPPRLLGAVAATVVLTALGWGGYLAYRRLGTQGPDYGQVASSYQQVYEELKQFRQDPHSRSPMGIKFQFSRRIAALRDQLQDARPDSPAARLGQAGSELTEMLSSFSAQPGSPEESKFSESEQQFLTLIDRVNSELVP